WRQPRSRPQARRSRCGCTSRYQSLCSSRMSAMACRIETLSGATSPPEALARTAARTRSIAPSSRPTSPSEVVPRRWASDCAMAPWSDAPSAGKKVVITDSQIECTDRSGRGTSLAPRPRGSPPWAVRSAGAGPCGDDLLVGLELVREVRHCDAEGLRIVVRAVPGTLLRAEWARQVIVRVGDVGAMLRIESHLEEVRKTATVAAR